jgi:hypothetical protein
MYDKSVVSISLTNIQMFKITFLSLKTHLLFSLALYLSRKSTNLIEILIDKSMNKIFIKISFIAIFLVITNNIQAQLGVTAQASGLKFLGDVGQKGNANFFSDMRLGYNLGVEYRIGKVLGVGLDGIYGKLAGTDNDKTSHLNFQSTIMGGGLNLYAFFDRLNDKENTVTGYIHSGIGYLMFDSYSDLKDKNGTAYNYWSDGSIRNLTESPTKRFGNKLFEKHAVYSSWYGSKI